MVAVGKLDAGDAVAVPLQTAHVADAKLGALGLGGEHQRLGERVAVQQPRVPRQHAAKDSRPDAGLKLTHLPVVEPLDRETVGLLRRAELAQGFEVVGLQGDCEDVLLGEAAVEAGSLGQDGVELAVQAQALLDQGEEGAVHAGARHDVEAPLREAGGGARHLLPLDDDGPHAHGGQVVGGGAPGDAPTHDYYVRCSSVLHIAPLRSAVPAPR